MDDAAKRAEQREGTDQAKNQGPSKADLLRAGEIDIDSLFDLSTWESEEETTQAQPATSQPTTSQPAISHPTESQSVTKPASVLQLPALQHQPLQTQQTSTSTDSKTSPSPARQSSARYEPGPRRFSPLKLAGGLTLRLLGLGAVGVLATGVGVAIAQFLYAPRVQQPPLLEATLSRTADVFDGLRELPKRTTQRLSDRLDPPPQPTLSPAAPLLAEAERQQIAAEIAGLQNELAQLSNRAATLEQQLGYDYAAAPLNLRVEALAQTVADPEAGPQSVAQRDRQSLAPQQPLVVRLPIDPLFETGQSSLKPASATLLGAILTELRAYPEGVVTISSYTDDVGSGVANRDLSLRRAQTVARYLQAQVGDSPQRVASNRFLWNTVGYGSAQPVAPNDSDENRQRNRRLEITVRPR